MKAVDANLMELLKKSERFIVPIYHRVYSWGLPECAQLWTDIVQPEPETGSAITSPARSSTSRRTRHDYVPRARSDHRRAAAGDDGDTGPGGARRAP